MEVWAIIPARGGSKSIPLKNLVPVCDVPLLDYSVRAAQAAHCVSKVICSTDHPEIAKRCQTLDVTVDIRPSALGGDETPVLDVITELFSRHPNKPDICLLVQPTSPFLRVEHIDQLVQALYDDQHALTGQTITPCPHNHHAYNQRVVHSGYVSFQYKAERLQAYNKQKKPKHFLFGNLLAFRPEAVLIEKDFFASPSVAVEIPSAYAFDLDIADDIVLAEAYLRSGIVDLPHMQFSLEFVK